MKALIPAAGFGSRLRPLTFSRPKPVLPVAGHPIIAYALQHLRSVGIEDIAIVTSDATEAPLRAALADWPDVIAAAWEAARDRSLQAMVADLPAAEQFTLAVQWHPEWQAAQNPHSVKIFQAFGDACREYVAQRAQ